jgi:hypothetical protein
VPGEPPQVRVQQVYGKAHAMRVIESAIADYAVLLSGSSG